MFWEISDMSRKVSREFSMQLLFQMEIQKEDRHEQLLTAFEERERAFSQNDRNYIENVVAGVFENVSSIDDLIEKSAKGWKLQRISRIDLSILRLCIYEIMYREDIPFTVSVNEAVELAKKYGTEESASFINGILSNANPEARGECDPAPGMAAEQGTVPETGLGLAPDAEPDPAAEANPGSVPEAEHEGKVCEPGSMAAEHVGEIGEQESEIAGVTAAMR
jgi:N utilization substance protein B